MAYLALNKPQSIWGVNTTVKRKNKDNTQLYIILNTHERKEPIDVEVWGMLIERDYPPMLYKLFEIKVEYDPDTNKLPMQTHVIERLEENKTFIDMVKNFGNTCDKLLAI